MLNLIVKTLQQLSRAKQARDLCVANKGRTENALKRITAGALLPGP